MRFPICGSSAFTTASSQRGVPHRRCTKRKGRLGEGRPLQVNHTKGASESGELPTDPMTAASMKIRQSPVVPRHRATGRFGLRPKRGKLKWLKDSSSALRFEHVCPTVNSTDEAAAHH